MTTTAMTTGVRWRFHETCPADWSARIDECAGGFFHSPAGLAACGEAGEPFYGELIDGDDLVGITAGVLRRCRVPPRPRHAYLPSPPALVPGRSDALGQALLALIDGAQDAGWTDVSVASYEANEEVPLVLDASRLTPRNEYDIPLAGTPEDLRARLATHHRRRLPDAGDGWTLRTLSGGEARALLSEVTQSAVKRAECRRGTGYLVTLPPESAFREDPAWGLTTYAVQYGEKTLSAALVGWAGRRAYYVSGGSTPDGYARNASVWLHYQVAVAFQSAGFTHYSLGGAPATAIDPQDPSHGLHRFKTAFGATVRSCAGARWVFGSEHEAGHRFTTWIRDRFPSSRETVR